MLQVVYYLYLSKEIKIYSVLELKVSAMYSACAKTIFVTVEFNNSLCNYFGIILISLSVCKYKIFDNKKFVLKAV